MSSTIQRALGVAAAMIACAASAETTIQRYSLDIDRAPLQTVLRQFSQQTGMGVSFLPRSGNPSEVLVGPLKGDYTVESALDEIVANNRLTYARVNEHTIAMMGNDDVPKRVAQRAAARPQILRVSTSPESGSDPGSGPASAKNVEKDVEEVIVTAQKRQERLQDVPISISVLGGVDLDRSSVEGITQALNRVPGVAAMVGSQGGNTKLSVRGVAAAGPLLGGSSPIAYYLDVVPFGTVLNAVVPDVAVYDLERVEVLRGPQGTLFGASAQNGVVRILSRDADLSAFELKARTSLSSTEQGGENYRGDMAVNVPIVADKLAVRAVLGYQDWGGWIDKPTLGKRDANDAEISTARLKINAQPTEAFDVGLSAWFSRSDYGAPPQSANGKTNAELDEPMSTDYDLFGLKLSYRLPAFSITSATGYLDFENDGFLDLRAFFIDALRTRSTAKMLSQEVILSSELEGPWRWTLGGMYRKSDEVWWQAYGLRSGNSAYGNVSRSMAVFGEATRAFSDGRFEVTAGLRYFEDEVTQEELIRPIPGAGFGGPPAQPGNTQADFDKLSPRLVFSWLPNEQLTAYLSYSEGFRSGANQNPIVVQQVPGFAPLKPDNLTNYEVGAKGSLWEGAINFDASVYYMDWQDVQQQLSVTVPGLSSFISATVNGTSASGMGVDLAVTTRRAAGWQLGLTFSGNDLTFDDQVISSGRVLFDRGDRLNTSPEYTAGLWTDYVFQLGRSGLEARVSASANYTSKLSTRTFSGTPPTSTLVSGDSMLISQLSASVSPSDSWVATLFIDNLNNEDGIVLRRFATSGPFLDWQTRVRPRTIGAQLEYRF